MTDLRERLNSATICGDGFNYQFVNPDGPDAVAALDAMAAAAWEFQCAIRANASARNIDAADKALTAALTTYRKGVE